MSETTSAGTSAAEAEPRDGLPPARARLSRVGDAIFKRVCQCAALLIVVLAALLAAILVWKSWLAIQTTGLGFFTTLTWCCSEWS
ncbi:MAG: hypothetical protein HYS12_28850 [Planctomycetes bacterium]|nr:hypothetical protein [Planctomycetota bacterium]